jgi:hypothetical protein
VALLVGDVFLKHIPKRSKLDWIANEQHDHKVLDFPIQDFKRHQGLFPWM